MEDMRISTGMEFLLLLVAAVIAGFVLAYVEGPILRSMSGGPQVMYNARNAA